MPKFWDCEQGTSRWLELRAGIPTASAFDKIITPKGEPSKSASGYCNSLLVEVMLGRPLAGTTMPWMTRGKEMEAEAVKYYELMRDVDTVPIGFVTTNDGRIGASPDRLVGERILLEVKCPTDETHTKYLAAHIDALLGAHASVAESYHVQCQGQLYVAERDWTDVLSYYPGLPEALTRVGRDEKFIAKLEQQLLQFLQMFDERRTQLIADGYMKADAQPLAWGEDTGPVLTREPKPRAQKKTPAAPPDLGEMGVDDEAVEAYIASLKREGTLK